MTTAFQIHELSVYRGTCPVVDSVSLSIEAGECVGLIGPNGAGKTTLLRASQGLLPFKGTSSLAELSYAERARRVAWMPQAREIAWPVSVETLVSLGRTPWRPPRSRLAPADHAAVDDAIARMGLEDFRHRPANQVSGGEQAKVLIARALAQETALLLADEPIAGLDPAAQIDTMATFAQLAQEGRGVLVALHDLALAARHCTRLVMLSAGRKVADGPPNAVLTPDLLAAHFSVTAHMEMSAAGLIFQPLDSLR